MSLGDIFGGEEEIQAGGQLILSPRDVISSPAMTEEVTKKADVAVEAFDEMSRKTSAYAFRKEELFKGVEDELRQLKEEKDAATSNYAEAKQELMEIMQKSGTYSIHQNDRADIKIKVIPGARKNITKTWLKDKFGDKGIALWDSAPRKPDKTDVVISAPFDDMPTD